MSSSVVSASLKRPRSSSETQVEDSSRTPFETAFGKYVSAHGGLPLRVNEEDMPALVAACCPRATKIESFVRQLEKYGFCYVKKHSCYIIGDKYDFDAVDVMQPGKKKKLLEKTQRLLESALPPLGLNPDLPCRFPANMLVQVASKCCPRASLNKDLKQEDKELFRQAQSRLCNSLRKQLNNYGLSLSDQGENMVIDVLHLRGPSYSGVPAALTLPSEAVVLPVPVPVSVLGPPPRMPDTIAGSSVPVVLPDAARVSNGLGKDLFLDIAGMTDKEFQDLLNLSPMPGVNDLFLASDDEKHG
jgi:hypothetical protein